MMFGIAQNSFNCMVLVFALLVVATSVRLLLQYRNTNKDYSELRQRTQSWWLMTAILFAALIVGKGWAIALFGFLSFLALKEFFSIVPIRQTDRRVVLLAYLSIPLQYYWISLEWYDMFIIFIPVCIFMLLPIRMVLIGETKGFIRSASIVHWALMLTVYCISHTTYLLILPVKNVEAGYIGPVLFLLFMTQFNDICQYVLGKVFGRNKIIPKVSPNKTWEGFIGGFLIITVFAGFLAPLLTPLTFAQGLIGGSIISIGGFFGDLVISSVKRDLQIKDSGNLIPGHGGILDRLDSLAFSAPLFFHFFYYVCF